MNNVTLSPYLLDPLNPTADLQSIGTIIATCPSDDEDGKHPTVGDEGDRGRWEGGGSDGGMKLSWVSSSSVF